MKQSDWQEIERILGAVLELPEDQRAAQVEQLCVNNSSLRGEVMSLLAAHNRASSFLDVKTQISSDSLSKWPSRSCQRLCIRPTCCGVLAESSRF